MHIYKLVAPGSLFMQLSSQLLSEYTVELSYDDIPEEVTEKTKRFILDTIGCAVGGYAMPALKSLRKVYQDREGGDLATIIGSGNQISVEYAGLINSSMGRYLDWNDVYDAGDSAFHPSDHIPALISIAEATGASGKELIEAVVVAYEIQCRCIDTNVMWNNGFDYATWGGPTAAAAVGKLMGLSSDELVSAIGIVGTSSNGLLASRGGEVSMWKGIAEPYAIHNAIQACQMVKGGLTGPQNVYNGEDGVVETIVGKPIELEGLAGYNREDFKILETNIKPYSAAYQCHGSIEAALKVRRQNEVNPDMIEEINISTFSRAMHAASPEKWTKDISHETADHSIPYTVAVALIDGEVTPAQYHNDWLSDPRVHRLMDCISVEEKEELNEFQRENPGSVPTELEIITQSEQMAGRVNYPPGNARNPMDDEELEKKFIGQCEEYLTEDQIKKAMNACYEIDTAASVDELIENIYI